MIRLNIKFVVLLGILLGFASAASAHHRPRFERCQKFSYTGRIEHIDWTNPHVQLVIRTDDGKSYTLGWLSLQALDRADIELDTLHVGDHVIVQGGLRPKDVENEPLWLSSIHRTSDGWEWSQPLQGC